MGRSGRACKSCHAAKVACGTLFTDACNRCRRLGHECVPRDPPSASRSTRKRRRAGTDVDVEAPAALDSAYAAAARMQLPAHLMPMNPQQMMQQTMGMPGGGADAAAHNDMSGRSGSLPAHQLTHAPLPGCGSPASPNSAGLMISVAVSLLHLSRHENGNSASAPIAAPYNAPYANAASGAQQPGQPQMGAPPPNSRSPVPI